MKVGELQDKWGDGSEQRNKTGKVTNRHHALDLVASEDAEDVVFKRQEEASRARVSLSCCPAPQLVVNAAALVTFCTDYVQSPKLCHLHCPPGSVFLINAAHSKHVHALKKCQMERVITYI